MRLHFFFLLTFCDELLDVSRVELFILEQVLFHYDEDGCRCTATATNVVPLTVAKSYGVLHA